MKSKLSTYVYAIYALVATFCVISIAFGLVFLASQPDATTVALANPSREVFDQPILEPAPDQSIMEIGFDQPTTEVADGQQVIATDDGQQSAETGYDSQNAETNLEQTTAETGYASPVAPSGATLEETETPAERVHSDTRYLAAFLALGRYEGLPGAQELYEPMLAELGVDFTEYDDIVAEVEAVTAALNAAPDIWHRYADATIAAALLPA